MSDNKTLTRKEARIALCNGNKVTHSYMLDGEYVFINSNGKYEFEDGITSYENEFWILRDASHWDIGWSIVD